VATFLSGKSAPQYRNRAFAHLQLKVSVWAHDSQTVLGVRFRNEIVTGFGGKQILVEDPSGNPVELFEPILPEARLDSKAPQ
jgi:hypothetical protein